MRGSVAGLPAPKRLGVGRAPSTCCLFVSAPAVVRHGGLMHQTPPGSPGLPPCPATALVLANRPYEPPERSEPREQGALENPAEADVIRVAQARTERHQRADD